MLHVVVICAGNYNNLTDDGALKPLAQQLDAQCWGLLPGFHRLVFEAGHVLLTLCIGDVAKLLRQQQFEADSINLNTAPLAGTDLLYVAKSIARLCKPGTLLATSGNSPIHAALKQSGFVFATGTDQLQATYSPSWVTKKHRLSVKSSSCLVVGAGLAGAAVASSLARRGWTVTVLDAASRPASGASSLPAGLLVPHTSPDDSPLSRLSRAGVRITLEQAGRILQPGQDWGHTGVLERSVDGVAKKLPSAWSLHWADQADGWSRPAALKQLLATGLPVTSTALWHAQAGWVKPGALVRAWLAATGINWRANTQVARLQRSTEGWQVLDAAGKKLAEAHLVVLASGYASKALAATAVATPLALQPIRGQVSWGYQALELPACPVNGHGGLLPNIPSDEGRFWLMGSTYQRDETLPLIKQQDNAENFQRLQTLLPHTATYLAEQFQTPNSRAWAGIRCATPNRLPLLRRLSSHSDAPLWVCAGMGSRGLTFAALCGELLAAQLHGEPLPIDLQLTASL
jgi:tRNA 5-methylaminomethyl-2-thiouridine biosynthesis bifunctional protein